MLGMEGDVAAWCWGAQPRYPLTSLQRVLGGLGVSSAPCAGDASRRVPGDAPCLSPGMHGAGPRHRSTVTLRLGAAF